MTPMMKQYFDVKKQYEEYILLYRLGDFYEMFFDDAVTGAKELDLALTGRSCGEDEKAPMCGVPYHSVDGYIGKLIKKGYKVAICEQTEDPAEAKGLVDRSVVRIITPGTVIESDLLKSTVNNYIASVYAGEEGYGVCFADISTSEVSATSFKDESDETNVINELGSYSPTEVIMNGDIGKYAKLGEYFDARRDIMLSDKEEKRFDYEKSKESVLNQFGARSESELSDIPLICAVGGLLDYIKEMEKTDVSYIKDLNVYGESLYMRIDVNTRRNLEITETMRTREKKGTLLWVLDKTKTSAGARTLKQWVEHPLVDLVKIQNRLNAVEELFGDFMTREETAAVLSKLSDLERLVTKVVFGTANGRDLRSIASSLAVIPDIKKIIGGCRSNLLRGIYDDIDALSDVYKAIDDAICDDPPFSVREGGVIRRGFNPEVDKLREIKENGGDFIKQIAEREKEKTGIKTLKTGYNRVFGYYIEVSKSFINDVPESYVRKQTLSNCERYITEELKNTEAAILGASDKLNALEYEIFDETRLFVADNSQRIRKTARALAALDALTSLASVASANKYVKPDVNIGDGIEIKDGRHPVVEKFVKDTYFVPNDTLLDTKSNRLMVITGPNMAGKSTYMRQIALITLMAQAGSFVPAKEASVGIVDRIFTRVGASDDLSSGQSTFMLEMTEVAYILKNATRNSLIIYDEVGRGTSTFDGMSIAEAIVEYTCKKIGAKTLFATHYHELTALEKKFDGIVNYNIAAKKKGDGIIFLRKIVRGSTDDSYGIEVAKLAGVPNAVIKRAKEILSEIERSSRNSGLTEYGGKVDVRDDEISFEDVINEQIADEIRGTDINTLSPYEAMTFLFRLKKKSEATKGNDGTGV